MKSGSRAFESKQHSTLKGTEMAGQTSTANDRIGATRGRNMASRHTSSNNQDIAMVTDGTPGGNYGNSMVNQQKEMAHKT